MQGMGGESPVDEDADKPPIIELRPTCLIVCPGIEFDEWRQAWDSLDQTSRSINWLIGDALSYGEDNYPDRWSQVLDAQYAEQHRGAYRVAQRIPSSHRREGLSWSAHREAAAVETLEERIELLDLAEASGWGSREIAAEVRRRREARQHNNPPPDGHVADISPDPSELPPDDSTWNSGEPPNAPEAGPAPQSDSGDAGGGEDHSPPPDTAEDASAATGAPTAAEIRACIAAVRKIANEIALGEAVLADINAVEWQVYRCAGGDGLNALTDHERALALVPKPWRGKITIEFGEHVFGGRAYSVDLRKPGGRQMAAGHGPSLPCAVVEAALSCLLSDQDAC